MVFRPEESFTVHGEALEHRHPITPYEGRRLFGVVRRTYLRGRRIYDEGNFPGEPGGRWQRRGNPEAESSTESRNGASVSMHLAEETAVAAYLDGLGPEAATKALTRCCGSRRWVEGMLARRPFGSDPRLYEAADEVWGALGPEDWREAFSHHPRLGERRLETAAPADTREWSRGEQAGAAASSGDVQRALAEGNALYEARFGHVFLLCATGKSGEEMLAELERRLEQSPEEELRTAADEQAKITRLRLAKLVDG